MWIKDVAACFNWSFNSVSSFHHSHFVFKSAQVEIFLTCVPGFTVVDLDSRAIHKAKGLSASSWNCLQGSFPNSRFEGYFPCHRNCD